MVEPHLPAAMSRARPVYVRIATLAEQSLQLEILLALPELQARPPPLQPGRTLLLRCLSAPLWLSRSLHLGLGNTEKCLRVSLRSARNDRSMKASLVP